MTAVDVFGRPLSRPTWIDGLIGFALADNRPALRDILAAEAGRDIARAELLVELLRTEMCLRDIGCGPLVTLMACCPHPGADVDPWASWCAACRVSAVVPEVSDAARLAELEDAAEDEGLLAADNRRTCSTCRTWATEAHCVSDEHWAAIDKAADAISIDELTVICRVPRPHGVHGMCFMPLPCPEHDEVLTVGPTPETVVAAPVRVDARSRRLDLILAAALAAGLVAGVGFRAGQAARPWARVLDDAAWTAVGGLVLAAVAAVAVAAARWFRSDWWPYRGNKVLGRADTLDAGEVSDGR